MTELGKCKFRFWPNIPIMKKGDKTIILNCIDMTCSQAKLLENAQEFHKHYRTYQTCTCGFNDVSKR
jgi:hypothetical protein